MTDLHTAVRRLFYVQNVPIEIVAKRHNMTVQQIQNIISNPNQTAMKKANTHTGGRPSMRNKKFDAKVKTLKKKGLTLAEIADLMDCSTSTVARVLGTAWTKRATAKRKVKAQVKTQVKTETTKVQSKTPKSKRGSTISLFWGAFTYTKTN